MILKQNFDLMACCEAIGQDIFDLADDLGVVTHDLNWTEAKRRKAEKLKLAKKLAPSIKKQEENARLMDLILKSDIDFSKFGWVSKVAELTGISTAHVNFFMKRNLPTFLEKECFKKKGKTVCK